MTKVLRTVTILMILVLSIILAVNLDLIAKFDIPWGYLGLVSVGYLFRFLTEQINKTK